MDVAGNSEFYFRVCQYEELYEELQVEKLFYLCLI